MTELREAQLRYLLAMNLPELCRKRLAGRI